MHIAHHQQQKNLIKRALVNYEFLKTNAIKHVQETDKFDMDYLSQSCLDVFFCKAFLGEDNDNKDLQDLIDSLTANLNFSVHVGKEIAYTFQDKTITVTPEARDYGVSPHIWNMAFWGSIILDDTESLKTLMNIDLEELLNASGKKKDYTFNMAVALKAFYLKQTGYPELLADALQANMDVPKNHLLYDKAMDIDGPALELLYLLLLERNEQFNERLFKALEWHKKYYIRLEKKRIQSNTGLVSLPVCAMVKLAKKLKQINIEHTSDYLPEYLLKE